MKFAVVIGVGPGPAALAQAVKTQSLFLQHMGQKLDSIRLAVPRHLEPACLGAVADRPDVLVVAGGPRTARRAGQIAYEKGVPILFLPGLRSLHWARRLWGSLALDGMIAALAREELRPARLGVGIAGDQIFFGEARCGLLPQLAQLHEAFHETDAFSEGWKVLARAASLRKSIARPSVEIHCQDVGITRAASLIVTAQGFDGTLSRTQSMPRLQTFSCTTWKYRGLFTYMAAVLGAAAGKDWRGSTEVEQFECEELKINARDGSWIVLDEEPTWFEGPVVFRFLPNAVRTCAFHLERTAANERGSGSG